MKKIKNWRLVLTVLVVALFAFPLLGMSNPRVGGSAMPVAYDFVGIEPISATLVTVEWTEPSADEPLGTAFHQAGAGGLRVTEANHGGYLITDGGRGIARVGRTGGAGANVNGALEIVLSDDPLPAGRYRVTVHMNFTGANQFVRNIHAAFVGVGVIADGQGVVAATTPFNGRIAPDHAEHGPTYFNNWPASSIAGYRAVVMELLVLDFHNITTLRIGQNAIPLASLGLENNAMNVARVDFARIADVGYGQNIFPNNDTEEGRTTGSFEGMLTDANSRVDGNVRYRILAEGGEHHGNHVGPLNGILTGYSWPDNKVIMRHTAELGTHLRMANNAPTFPGGTNNNCFFIAQMPEVELPRNGAGFYVLEMELYTEGTLPNNPNFGVNPSGGNWSVLLPANAHTSLNDLPESEVNPGWRTLRRIVRRAEGRTTYLGFGGNFGADATNGILMRNISYRRIIDAAEADLTYDPPPGTRPTIPPAEYFDMVATLFGGNFVGHNKGGTPMEVGDNFNIDRSNFAFGSQTVTGHHATRLAHVDGRYAARLGHNPVGGGIGTRSNTADMFIMRDPSISTGDIMTLSFDFKLDVADITLYNNIVGSGGPGHDLNNSFEFRFLNAGRAPVYQINLSNDVMNAAIAGGELLTGPDDNGWQWPVRVTREGDWTTVAFDFVVSRPFLLATDSFRIRFPALNNTDSLYVTNIVLARWEGDFDLNPQIQARSSFNGAAPADLRLDLDQRGSPVTQLRLGNTVIDSRYYTVEAEALTISRDFLSRLVDGYYEFTLITTNELSGETFSSNFTVNVRGNVFYETRTGTRREGGCGNATVAASLIAALAVTIGGILVLAKKKGGQ